MGHHHQFSIRPEQAGQGGQIQPSLPIAGNAVEAHPPVSHLVQGTHDRVVLQGGDNAVPSSAQSPLQDQVQPKGGSRGENCVVRMGKVEKAAQSLPQIVDHAVRPPGGGVGRTAHGCPLLLQVAKHGGPHRHRLGKGGGGIVQIDGPHSSSSLANLPVLCYDKVSGWAVPSSTRKSR